jgi:SrtB family sortase
MRSDHEQPGTPSRRSQAAPVPGMPYRPRSDPKSEPAAAGRREFDFIESRPLTQQRGVPEDAYNSWEEQGWLGRETAFSVQREPEVLQEPYAPSEERYFKPMPGLGGEPANAYADEDAYAEDEPYPEPEIDIPADQPLAELPPPPPPMPPRPKRTRRFEPWRTAVILSCVAGLLFCGVEIFRIAQNVVQSDAEIRDYREIFLKENNEDFSLHAQAVPLRPPGETYPPTASPVPVVTPTPTPRIAQNDPLIAAMSSGGLNLENSVAPGAPAGAVRSLLERYPLNPLLVIRDEIAALQKDNPDIVGHLIIDGLLSELVVQRNNTYYLNHNSMGSYSGYGAVFADENLSLRTPPENILLYGRTSTEGKAFAPLKNYAAQGLDFAENYAFLSLNTLYEEARYVIVAIVKANGDPNSPDYFDYKHLAFASDQDMMQYVETAMGRSLRQTNVGVMPADRLLTLVTLPDGADTESLVIVCRMLRDGEQDGYIQSR